MYNSVEVARLSQSLHDKAAKLTELYRSNWDEELLPMIDSLENAVKLCDSLVTELLYIEEQDT